MVSAGNGEEIGSYYMCNPLDFGTPNENGCNIDNHIILQMSTSIKGVLSDENAPRNVPEYATSLSGKLKLVKISPNGNIASNLDEKLSSAIVAPPPAPPRATEIFRRPSNKPFYKKLKWPSKEWFLKPLNMLLILWLICVVICGLVMFLLMTGALNSAIHKKSQRDKLFEIFNQIIVAVITLMCLYQHPKRIYDSLRLCRWNQQDISKLQKEYCKNGTPKPNERFHMIIVVVLLQINFIAQYALLGLNIGYNKDDRPVAGVVICIVVNLGALVIAGIYSVRSPLGKDSECDGDVEAPHDRHTPATLPREEGATA